jgi:hypothetical protein
MYYIMSLRLNKDSAGSYANMFDIEVLPTNSKFVYNPYKPGKYKCNDSICFSLSEGARPHAQSELVYNAEGKMIKMVTP